MLPNRTLLPFLMIALLALVVAACGSNDSSTSDTSDSRDAGSESNDDVEPGSTEAVEEKSGGSGGFAITPRLTACLGAAGFERDTTTVAGGIASWSSDAGAHVVVTPSSEAALSVASELGTTEAPASVDGVRVSAGPAAPTSAAAACLDA